MKNMALGGLAVVETIALPSEPSPGTWARRYMRHGLRDWVEYLGWEVGPAPDEVTNAIRAGNVLLVSPGLMRLMEDEARETLPIHRTEAGHPNCATCDGGGCLDCTDPA